MLKDNEIFIATTDTLIGIGSKISDSNLEKIYNLKKRPKDKKIVIVVGSIDQLKKIEKVDDIAMEQINKFWPGSVTLIINGNSYRMPNKEGLLKLIIKEGPFYLTSANVSGEPNCTTIEEVQNLFPSINKVYNFGYGNNIASTIIDVKSGKKLR